MAFRRRRSAQAVVRTQMPESPSTGSGDRRPNFPPASRSDPFYVARMFLIAVVSVNHLAFFSSIVP